MKHTTHTHHNKKGVRNNNRNYQNNRTIRVLDSNGPAGRLKGTAKQLSDKYKSLAYETINDALLKEEFFQYADYYKRLTNNTENGVYRIISKPSLGEHSSLDMENDYNHYDNHHMNHSHSTPESTFHGNSHLRDDSEGDMSSTRKRVIKTIKIKSDDKPSQREPNTRFHSYKQEIEEPKALRQGRSRTSEDDVAESLFEEKRNAISREASKEISSLDTPMPKRRSFKLSSPTLKDKESTTTIITPVIPETTTPVATTPETPETPETTTPTPTLLTTLTPTTTPDIPEEKPQTSELELTPKPTPAPKTSKLKSEKKLKTKTPKARVVKEKATKVKAKSDSVKLKAEKLKADKSVSDKAVSDKLTADKSIEKATKVKSTVEKATKVKSTKDKVKATKTTKATKTAKASSVKEKAKTKVKAKAKVKAKPVKKATTKKAKEEVVKVPRPRGRPRKIKPEE